MSRTVRPPQSPARPLRSRFPVRMLLAMALLGLSGPTVQAGNVNDLNIGVIASLTGPGAGQTQDMLDGFKLALKDLGGRLGAQDVNLTVMDDRRSPVLARQAALRLIRDEHSQILIVASKSEPLHHILSLPQTARTTVISLAPPPPDLTGKGCRPQIFYLQQPPELIHEQAGQFFRQHGFRRVLVPVSSQAEADAVLPLLQQNFKGEVQTQIPRRGQMRHSEAITSRRTGFHPDGIYLLYRQGLAVSYLRDLTSDEHHDESVEILAPHSSFDPATAAGAGSASFGLFTLGSWREDGDSPANHRLVSGFESDVGRPVSLAAAVGYDSALLLDAALRLTDKRFTQPEVLQAALHGADWVSTRGPWKFAPDNQPLLGLALRQIVAGPRDRPVGETRETMPRDLRSPRGADCPMRWMPPPAPLASVKPPVTPPVPAPATATLPPAGKRPQTPAAPLAQPVVAAPAAAAPPAPAENPAEPSD